MGAVIIFGNLGVVEFLDSGTLKFCNSRRLLACLYLISAPLLKLVVLKINQNAFKFVYFDDNHLHTVQIFGNPDYKKSARRTPDCYHLQIGSTRATAYTGLVSAWEWCIVLFQSSKMGYVRKNEASRSLTKPREGRNLAFLVSFWGIMPILGHYLAC